MHWKVQTLLSVQCDSVFTSVQLVFCCLKWQLDINLLRSTSFCLSVSPCACVSRYSVRHHFHLVIYISFMLLNLFCIDSEGTQVQKLKVNTKILCNCLNERKPIGWVNVNFSHKDFVHYGKIMYSLWQKVYVSFQPRNFPSLAKTRLVLLITLWNSDKITQMPLNNWKSC